MPDVLLIDGGPGQLQAARDALDAVGAAPAITLGVAKGPTGASGRSGCSWPVRTRRLYSRRFACVTPHPAGARRGTSVCDRGAPQGEGPHAA